MTHPAHALVEQTLAMESLFGADGPCPATLGAGTLPDLIAVTGANAEGKSVFCKILETHIRKSGTSKEVMRIGMGIRTNSGMIRGLMFGNEDSESVGSTSGRVMLTTFDTSRNRTHPHWIILDEPDIGMGESYHRAIGDIIVDFARNRPDHLQGLVIVSHARRLVSPLIEAGATSVRMGRDAVPVRDWLRDGDIDASIDDFLALSQRASQTRDAVRRATQADRVTS